MYIFIGAVKIKDMIAHVVMRSCTIVPILCTKHCVLNSSEINIFVQDS